MLLPRSYAWTRAQKYLIAGAVVAAVIASSALIQAYERFCRGPDDSYFVGAWRGKYEPTTLFWGVPELAVRFNRDYTYQDEDSGMLGGGKWYAGGDFLFLKVRAEDSSGPIDRLEVWHIDSMASDEVHMTRPGGHAILKRIE